MKELKDFIVEYNNQVDDNIKKIMLSRIILSLASCVREKALLPILVSSAWRDASNVFSYNVDCLTHHGTPQVLADMDCHSIVPHYKEYDILCLEGGRFLREIKNAGDCGMLQLLAENDNTISLWEDDVARILDPKKRFYILQGDITVLPVDAVVNSANKNHTDSFGGVNHAILKAAGPTVKEELLRATSGFMNGCVTSAGNLPAQNIIHVTAPDVEDFNTDPDGLYYTYKAIFDFAKANDLHVLAIPSLGTGKKGIPKKVAANVAINVTQKWMEYNPEYDLFVFFVTFSQDSYKAYIDKIQGVSRS